MSTPGTIDEATATYRRAVLKASREFLAALYKIAGEDVREPFVDPGPHYDAADIAMDTLEIAASIEGSIGG